MTDKRIFRRIVAAVALSPWRDLVLGESARLAAACSTPLTVLHVGSASPKTRTLLGQSMAGVGLDPQTTPLLITPGDPVRRIRETAIDQEADLIIIGAMEQETLMRYYFGSVARSIARHAPCSVLLLAHPRSTVAAFSTLVLDVDYSPNAPHALELCVELARREHSRKIYMVHDYQILGLSMAGEMDPDGGVSYRRKCQGEETRRLREFISTVEVGDLSIEPVCQYGPEGWKVVDYAHQVEADLLILPAPVEGLGFMDRVFPHDLEWSLRRLPCALLVARPAPAQGAPPSIAKEAGTS